MTEGNRYVEKMKTVCGYWSYRHLGLKAKIVVLNVLVFPIIYYYVCNRFCADELIKKVLVVSDWPCCNLAIAFLWNGHASKIAHNTLTLSVAEGGLGLHNFEVRVQAARFSWVWRIVMSSSGFCTEYFQQQFQVNSVLE